MDSATVAGASLRCETQFEYPSYVFDTAQKALFVATLKAQTQELARAPVDICAVIDRSASMQGNKLELVKEATKFMVKEMSAIDRLSLVSFNDQVQDIYGGSGEMHFMTTGNKKVAAAAISRVQCGGGTNLSGGLFRGVDHHQQSSSVLAESFPGSSERVRSVFLFTDGCSNSGLRDINQINPILSAMLHHSISPKIYTFGFGNDVDDSTLNALSEEGNGQSAFIEDPESIPGAFASALGGLMSMTVQNLELTFSPKERASLCRVVTSFKKTAQADGSIKVAVGDMLADEQKDFLVELELPGFSIPDVTLTVLELHARYLDVCSACMREITFQASILRTTDTAGLRPSHPLILEHVQRIEASTALQDAQVLAEQGDFASARAMLETSRESLSRGPDSVRSRRLAQDLSTTITSFANEQTYQLQGRQMSSRFGREHGRQYASVASRGRESTYATNAQLSMSRRSQPETSTTRRTAVAGHAECYPAPATWQCVVPQPPAVGIEAHLGVGPGSNRYRMAQSHHSTATLPYSAGHASEAGHKRDRTQDGSGALNDSEARSGLAQETGYNTRAKKGRTFAQ